MRKLVVIMTFLGLSLSGFAQDKNAKASIEVDGVCMMCKFRIEKAAVKSKGVKSANWNMETHILDLIFDERKTDLTTIKTNIAAVGHDTKDIKATIEAYESVDDCCRYRDEQIVKDHQNGKKKGGH
ncbi:heavy-metal-associated domain-containing protein [Aureitalea marina]|uniref:HMA domain-containing protein n=1 Tax=Aureitalea marina TaxID=930804 RepID=A0A2S7KLT9_9FLAO|nr:cation transporter [Aureitalea marina]PQB03587.1 hypothetical protein BST85_00740 [Aureitalea marina]